MPIVIGHVLVHLMCDETHEAHCSNWHSAPPDPEFVKGCSVDESSCYAFKIEPIIKLGAPLPKECSKCLCGAEHFT